MGEGKETFRSFGDLKDYFDKGKESRDKQTREEIGELYSDYLEGKFSDIPGASYALDEGNTTREIWITPRADAEAGKGVLHVKLVDRDPSSDRILRSADGIIQESVGTGMVSMKERDLQKFDVSRVELSKLVLDRIRGMAVNKKMDIEGLKIFPEKDPAAEAGGGEPPARGPITPPRRESLEWLLNSPQVLAWSQEPLAWHNDGRVVVLRRGIIVETPDAEHHYATYVKRFDEPLPDTLNLHDETGKQRIRRAVLEVMSSEDARSRYKFRTKLGAKRLYHTPTWKSRLQGVVSSLA